MTENSIRIVRCLHPLQLARTLWLIILNVLLLHLLIHYVLAHLHPIIQEESISLRFHHGLTFHHLFGMILWLFHLQIPIFLVHLVHRFQPSWKQVNITNRRLCQMISCGPSISCLLLKKKRMNQILNLINVCGQSLQQLRLVC